MARGWGLATGWGEIGEGALDEWRGVGAEDRTVAAAGHHPERRLRDRAIHLHRELDRVERIAIAVHDQLPRSS